MTMTKSIGTLLLGLFLLSSCNNDDLDKKAQIKFYITDAPAIHKYEAVYLDVQSIDYSLGGEKWENLPMQPKTIELLQFNNGKDSLLSNIYLDPGAKIQQIRLKLGDKNTLLLSDGSSVNLKVPSGQTSGLKINVHSVADLLGGYKVVVDFDASRSIVAQGNGGYHLKPVVRAYIEANTSSIEGYLTPADKKIRVFTLNAEGDTIATVSDIDNKNFFKIHGLFSGNYNVQVQDLVTGKFAVLKADQAIVGGTDVNLGTLSIPAN